MDYTLKIDAEPSGEDVNALHHALRGYNTSLAGPGDHSSLLLTLHDSDKNHAGGLFARISYGWVYIDLLWVAENARGRGQGTRLLRAAEEEARIRGCSNAWIDTFNPSALSLYENNGYVVFGELADYPPGFTRYFLRKPLNTAI